MDSRPLFGLFKRSPHKARWTPSVLVTKCMPIVPRRATTFSAVKSFSEAAKALDRTVRPAGQPADLHEQTCGECTAYVSRPLPLRHLGLCGCQLITDWLRQPPPHSVPPPRVQFLISLLQPPPEVSCLQSPEWNMVP